MVRCEPWRCRDVSTAQTQQLLCLACERIVAAPISKCIWVRGIDGVNRLLAIHGRMAGSGNAGQSGRQDLVWSGRT